MGSEATGSDLPKHLPAIGTSFNSSSRESSQADEGVSAPTLGDSRGRETDLLWGGCLKTPSNLLRRKIGKSRAPQLLSAVHILGSSLLREAGSMHCRYLAATLASACYQMPTERSLPAPALLQVRTNKMSPDKAKSPPGGLNHPRLNTTGLSCQAKKREECSSEGGVVCFMVQACCCMAELGKSAQITGARPSRKEGMEREVLRSQAKLKGC